MNLLKLFQRRNAGVLNATFVIKWTINENYLNHKPWFQKKGNYCALLCFESNFSEVSYNT